MDIERPPKVLHVVESLGTGAVESWLLRMMAHSVECGIPFDWSFYCQLTTPGASAEEASRLGARVDASPVPLSRTLAFLRALRRHVRQLQPDIVHMHHDILSGLYLLAFSGLRCKTIVHVHNRALSIPVGKAVHAALLRPFLWRSCLSADRLVANSADTLAAFLRGRPARPTRDLVHLCGVDSSPFQAAAHELRRQVRAELQISHDTHLLLFAGRVVPEKNPLLVLDVLARVRAMGLEASALFVGDGSSLPEVRAKAVELGLDSAVHTCGFRADVYRYMLASDCFMLATPDSPGEGFGLAVVEAQLAGLPVLVSHGIPDEALLEGARSIRLSSAESVERWAAEAGRLLTVGWQSPVELLERFKESPLAMGHALSLLGRIHGELVA